MGRTVDGRLAYADLLRCAAMLAVIVVHVTGGSLEAAAVGSPAFQVLNLYDSLAHWCVPVFVMLSGMFLLDPKHSLPPSKLFFGHILRIAVALAVWGTAYALVTQVSAGGLSWASVRAALYQVLLGRTHFHLWFLYMIMGLYLFSPILRRFISAASRRDLEYFLVLYFIFTLLMPAYTCCMWLIVAYQARAADPVILDYVYELFAIIAVLLGLYFIAGFSFERPKVRRASFFSLLGV